MTFQGDTCFDTILLGPEVSTLCFDTIFLGSGTSTFFVDLFFFWGGGPETSTFVLIFVGSRNVDIFIICFGFCTFGF